MKHLFQIVLTLLLCLWVTETKAQSGMYVVTGDSVVIRSGPGTGYSKLCSRKKGETVNVLSLYDGQWAKIEMGYGKVGYISRHYITYKGNSVNSNDSSSKKTTKSSGATPKDVWLFWICVILGVTLYYLSLTIDSVWSILWNILSLVSFVVWAAASDDCFWFLDFANHIFRSIFFLGLVMGLGGIVIRTAWENIKYITNIKYEPAGSIISFILGLAWAYLFLRLLIILIDNHPFVILIMILGVLPASKVPTIYVAGEGHITGHGYNGGDRFHGDNGYDYWYDGNDWRRS